METVELSTQRVKKFFEEKSGTLKIFKLRLFQITIMICIIEIL